MSEPTSGKRPPGSLPPLELKHSKPHEEEGGEGNWLVSYADMMTLLVGFFVILLSFATIDPKKFDEARKSVTEEFGGKYQVPYAKLAEALREVAKKLGVGDQFLIKESTSGIEISSRGTVFFNTGSADLKEEAQNVLLKMIEVVKSDPSQFNITIEGHTDDVPLAEGKAFRNNFELSSIRACRVLDSFLSASVPKDRLTAVGYGDARPLVPNRDEKGNAIAENQAQNRRVVIKIMKSAERAIPLKDGDTPVGATVDAKNEAPASAAEAPRESAAEAPERTKD
jgi:chemotaxis protein MotB